MRREALGYVGIAIVAEVVATLCLKGALGHSWLLVVVVLGYVAAFAALAAALRRGLGVGTAYGVWGACGVVLTALGSRVLFNEGLTPLMLAGLALVSLGVVLVEVGAQRAHRVARWDGEMLDAAGERGR